MDSLETSLTGLSPSFHWTIEIFTHWDNRFSGDLLWLDSLPPLAGLLRSLPIVAMYSLETPIDWTLSLLSLDYWDNGFPGDLLKLDYWDLHLLKQWILWRRLLTGLSSSFDWTIEIFTYWDNGLSGELLWQDSLPPSTGILGSSGLPGDLHWLDSLPPFTGLLRSSQIEAMESLEISFDWTLSPFTGLLKSSPIEAMDSLGTSVDWTLSLLSLDYWELYLLRQWILWRPPSTGLLRSSPIESMDSLEISVDWTLSLLWLDY